MLTHAALTSHRTSGIYFGCFLPGGNSAHVHYTIITTKSRFLLRDHSIFGERPHPETRARHGGEGDSLQNKPSSHFTDNRFSFFLFVYTYLEQHADARAWTRAHAHAAMHQWSTRLVAPAAHTTAAHRPTEDPTGNTSGTHISGAPGWLISSHT